MPEVYYIRELANHFKNNIVWLNPEIIKFNWQPWTPKVISSIIPMFCLSEREEKAENTCIRGYISSKELIINAS